MNTKRYPWPVSWISSKVFVRVLAFLAFCPLLITSCVAGRGVSVVPQGPRKVSYGNVGALAIYNDALYVGLVGQKGIAKSVDQGETWTRTAVGFENQDVYAILPISEELLLAGTGSTGGGVILRSADGGAHWQRTKPLVPSDLDVHALTLDSAGTVYAGTTQGLFVSENQGETWYRRSTGLEPLDTRVLAVSEEALYAGTLGGGVFVTANKGVTWKPFNEGLEDLRIIALAWNEDQDPPTLYAGTTGQGLWRRTIEDENWHRITNGLNPDTVQSVYAIVSDPGTGALFIGVHEAGVYASYDYSATWVPFGHELSDARISTLVVGDYSGGNIMYAGVWEGECLWKTPVTTAEWQPANNGLETARLYWPKQVVVAAGRTADLLYADISDDPCCASTLRLAMSDDGGQSWQIAQPISETLFTTVLAKEPDQTGSLWIGTSGDGIWRCGWDLSNCVSVNRGLPQNESESSNTLAAVTDFLFVPAVPPQVIVSTRGGLFRLNRTSDQWESISEGLDKVDLGEEEHRLLNWPGDPGLLYLISKQGAYARHLSEDVAWVPVFRELSAPWPLRDPKVVAATSPPYYLYVTGADAIWQLDPQDQTALRIRESVGHTDFAIQPRTGRMYAAFANGIAMGQLRGEPRWTWALTPVLLSSSYGTKLAVSKKEPEILYMWSSVAATPLYRVTDEYQRLAMTPYGRIYVLAVEHPLEAGLTAGLITAAAFVVQSVVDAKTKQRRRLRVYEGWEEPYKVGGPIRDPRQFFGRYDEVNTALTDLRNDDHVAFYGERRIGKTSLLYQIKHLLESSGSGEVLFIPAIVSLQAVPEDRFFVACLKAVFAECPSDWAPELTLRVLSNPDRYDSLDFLDDLALLVEAGQSKTGRQVRFVLLMDEGDRINEYDQRTQEGLRGITMSTTGKHILLVWSGRVIIKDWDLDSSPWFNLFKDEVRLAGFSEEETRQVITQPVKGLFRYQPEAVARILEYSAGRPLEVQRLCSMSVRALAGGRRRKITAGDVDMAYSKWVDPNESGGQPG